MKLNRIGNRTTWNDASGKLNENFDKIGLAIESIEAVGVGEITSTDGSIGVAKNDDGINLSVQIGNLLQDKKGLYVGNNKIGVAVDPNEGNRLTMTPTGMLRVEDDVYTKTEADTKFIDSTELGQHMGQYAYSKGESYNKTETDDKIRAAVSALGTVFRVKEGVEEYDQLPMTGNENGDVRQVAKGSVTEDSISPIDGIEFADNTEFFWNGSKWEILGVNEVDMSDFVNKTDVVSLAATPNSVVGRDGTGDIRIHGIVDESGNLYALPRSPLANSGDEDFTLQEQIDDLDAIREGAAKGATALQEEQYKGTVKSVQLLGTLYNPDSSGNVNLGYGVGTVQTITMNGKYYSGTSIDLGTVVTDVSDKQDSIEDLEEIREGAKTRMINVTYDELVALRDNGNLKAGMQYRITDYVTTTVQPDTKSAGHQFDVIVTADTENTLNEKARACLHDGDTYFSENNANLEAWQIWYCLDNDINRFAWAQTSLYSPITKQKMIIVNDGGETYIYVRDSSFDSDGKCAWLYDAGGDNISFIDYIKSDDESLDSSDIIYTDSEELEVGAELDMMGTSVVLVDMTLTEGKGVIYRMIDEWNNDCPYDFKNIQFLNKHVVKSSADIKIKPEYLNSDGVFESPISIEYMISVDDQYFTEYNQNIKSDVFISCGYEINPDGNEALCLYKTDVNSHPDEPDGADPFFYVGQTYVYGELFELWKKAERTNYGKGDLVWYTGAITSPDPSYKYALTYPITTDIYIPKGELYTFNIFDGGETADLSIYGGVTDEGYQQFVHDNKILPYTNYQGSYELNNIVFNHDTDYDSIFYGVYGNEIGVNSSNLYFGNNCQCNKIGNCCCDVKFSNDCSKNVIGDDCFTITMHSGCKFNTLNTTCHSIFMGNACHRNFLDCNCVEISLGFDSSYNTFGKESHEIRLGADAYYNRFNEACYYIIAGGSFYFNSFNSGCADIYLGENVSSCSFGLNCFDIWIRDAQAVVPSNTVSNIIFGDCCRVISLQCPEGPEMGDLKNYTIVAGTSEIDEIMVFRNRNYETKIARNSKGEVKEYCEADLIA